MKKLPPIKIKIEFDDKDAQATVSRLEKAFRNLHTSNPSSLPQKSSSLGSNGGSMLAELNKFVVQSERTAKQVSNNKIREEMKAAAEVAKINQQTVRQHQQNERLLERAETQLANHRIKEAQRAQKATADGFSASLKQTQSQPTQAGGVPSGSLRNSIVGSFVGNLGAQAVSEVTSLAKQGASAWLEYSSKLEQARIGFTTMTGSAQEADKHLKELQDFAKTTPFEFGDLVEASRKLQGVGIEANKVIPILTDVGNALAASGRIGELPEATKAISDIAAKGKLAGQEIIQLANAGIPAFQALSKATGKTQAEIVKLSESGAISSKFFLQALHEYSQQRFGDAMEKQSRTFSGAMSNIKDALYQTSATAFAPLYEKISNLAVRFADDIQKQGNDFEGVGRVIAQYIGEGLGLGLETILDSAAGYIGNRLKNIFSKGEIVDPLFSSIFKGFLKPFGFFKDEAVAVNKPLSDINNSLAQTKDKISGLPSLGKQIDAEKAAADAEKLSGELKKIAVDLATKILFFGQETEVAAVKQQLLAKGVSDFNGQQAKTILGMAATIDKLKEQQEAQKKAADEQKKIAEDYQRNLENISEQLKKTREDARFESEFANPTKLQEFDRYVKQSAGSFRELKGEIAATRRELQNAEWIKSFRGLVETTKGLISAVNDETNGLELNGLEGFQRKIADIGASIQNVKGLSFTSVNFDDPSNNLFPEDFAKKVDGFVSAFETYKQATQGLGDAEQATTSFKNYLVTLAQVNVVGEQHPLFSDKEATAFIQRAIRLKEVTDAFAVKSARDASLGEYKQVLGDLNGKLTESSNLTEYARVANLLLGDSYKSLTQDERDNLLAKAGQVDAMKQAQEAQKEYQKLFDQTKGFFSETIGAAVDGGFKGLFKSLKDRFKKLLIDLAAEWLTSKFLGIFTGKSSSGLGGASGGLPSNGGSGGFLDSIKKLFGGNGAQSSGGSPPPFVGNFPNAAAGQGSYFNGGNAGGSSNIIQNLLRGGGTNGTRTGDTLDGVMQVIAGDKGRKDIFSNLKSLFSSKDGGLLGKGGIFGAKGFGNNVGTYGAIGGGAALLGGLIGGRAGGFISGAGQGLAMGAQIGSMIMPGIGTAAGAAIGAGIGALVGLFTGGTKKKDTKTWQAGVGDAFTQLTTIKAQLDRRPPSINWDTGISNSTQIQSQYYEAMNQLKDKKTRNKAIADGRARIDPLVRQIAESAAQAHAWDINRGQVAKDFVGEFANGVYMDSSFRAQHDDFKRYNGMMPGRYTGRDYIKALIGDGEIVANETQLNRMRRAAGFDVVAHAGLPNYKPKAAETPRFAGGVSFAAPVSGSGSNNNSQKTPEIAIGDIVINLNGKRITDAEIESIAINGVTKFVNRGGRTAN